MANEGKKNKGSTKAYKPVRVRLDIYAIAQKYADIAGCTLQRAINDALALVFAPESLGFREAYVRSVMKEIGVDFERLGKALLNRAAATPASVAA